MALTERLAILLETVGASTVAREFDKVGDAAKKAGKSATEGAGGIKLFGRETGITAGALKAGLVAGAAAAGAAVVGFGVKAVQTYQESTQAVLGFQRASGASAETSSLLVAAFDDMGISAESGAKAVFQLGKRLETSADGLAKFGVEAVKDSRGNTDLAATLLEVSDAYVNTADPAQRAALLAAAFGKQAQEMIPILEKGRAGIEAMFQGARDTGQVFSQADLKRSEDFRLAVDELSDAMREFSLAAGRQLVPILTDLLQFLSAAADKAEGAGHAMKGGFFAPIIEALGGTAMATLDAKHQMDELSRGVDTYSSMVLVAGQTSKQMAHDVEAEAKALKEALGATLATTAAQRSYDESVRGVTRAQERAADAHETLNELLARGAVDTQAVTRAQRDLAQAIDAVARAERGSADAKEDLRQEQEELNDLLSGRAATKAGKGAADDVTQAQFRQRRATLSLHDAQDRLSEVMRTSDATADELATAQLNVEESTFDLRQADEGLAEAQRKVNEAGRIGAENSKQTIDARARVKQAAEQLALAEQGVATALEDVEAKRATLRQAEAGDPGFADDVAKARRNLRDAEYEVAGAKSSVSQQAYALATAQSTENDAMRDAPGLIGQVRGELEALLRLQPAAAAFLGPTLAGLGQWSTVGGPASSTGNFLAGLKPYQSGGFVPAGVTQPALLHGPEAVIPLGGGGGGGGSQSTVIQLVLDGRVLTEVVHNGLLAKQRRSGNLGIVSP